MSTDAASRGPATAWSRRRRSAGRNTLLRGSGARGGVGVEGSGPGLGAAEAPWLPWIPPAVELGPASCSASARCWSFRRPWSSRGAGELRRRGVDLEVGLVRRRRGGVDLAARARPSPNPVRLRPLALLPAFVGRLRGSQPPSRRGLRSPHHRDRIPARPWLPVVSSAPPRSTEGAPRRRDPQWELRASSVSSRPQHPVPAMVAAPPCLRGSRGARREGGGTPAWRRRLPGMMHKRGRFPWECGKRRGDSPRSTCWRQSVPDEMCGECPSPSHIHLVRLS
jgi:hypothetical protein